MSRPISEYRDALEAIQGGSKAERHIVAISAALDELEARREHVRILVARSNSQFMALAEAREHVTKQRDEARTDLTDTRDALNACVADCNALRARCEDLEHDKAELHESCSELSQWLGRTRTKVARLTGAFLLLVGIEPHQHCRTCNQMAQEAQRVCRELGIDTRLNAALRDEPGEGEETPTVAEVQASYDRLCARVLKETGEPLAPARFIRCDSCEEILPDTDITHDPASGINLCAKHTAYNKPRAEGKEGGT